MIPFCKKRHLMHPANKVTAIVVIFVILWFEVLLTNVPITDPNRKLSMQWRAIPVASGTT